MKRTISYARSVIRNNLGMTDHPKMLTYITTFRCNCRCSMCGSWRKPHDKEMTIDEIARVFKGLPRFDAVRLSGGEPFLRPDFGEIAELAQETLRPTILHITTNGSHPDRIVDFCRKRNKNISLHLMVSIDGMREYHDRLRRRNRSWDHALVTLQRLAAEKRKLNLRLLSNQTIMDDEGLAQFPVLRGILRGMGISHGAVIAYRDSATYGTGNAGKNEFFDLDTAALSRFIIESDNYGAHDDASFKIAKGYYYWGIYNRLILGKNTPKPKCAALGSHMHINPDGSVPVCQFNGTVVGDVTMNDFKEIWGGEKAQTMRRWVKNCTGYWAECEILPSAIYSGDIVKQLMFFNGKSVWHAPRTNIKETGMYFT